MKKRLLKKIIKTCGSPMDFMWEYIDGGSIESGIRRMKEYVKCVQKVERESKK